MKEERGSAAVKSEGGSIPLLLPGEAEEVDRTKTEERGQDESTALAGSGGEVAIHFQQFYAKLYTSVCFSKKRVHSF